MSLLSGANFADDRVLFASPLSVPQLGDKIAIGLTHFFAKMNASRGAESAAHDSAVSFSLPKLPLMETAET